MTYRTRRSSGTGSLFGVLAILAVLYIPTLRHTAEDVVTVGVRYFLDSITPAPTPTPTPAPPVRDDGG